MATITREAARMLVLERLRAWIGSIPEAEKAMPRLFIGGRPYSPLDLLREVEMGTTIGWEYVFSQASALGYIIT